MHAQPRDSGPRLSWPKMIQIRFYCGTVTQSSEGFAANENDGAFDESCWVKIEVSPACNVHSRGTLFSQLGTQPSADRKR